MLDAPRTGFGEPELYEAQSHFDDLSADLVLQTRSLLNRIVGDETLHPKLMNTLSMLEHMGSHKIMATRHGSAIEQATLRHLAEECQHAFFMKRQAEKAAKRALAYEPDDLLAPVAARMYFRRLEAWMLRALPSEGSSAATYLYMSMIVELRAVWFYSLYQQALSRHGHPLSLKRLLGEEQNHLTEMAGRLGRAGHLSDARVDLFIRTERALYGRFLDSLRRSIS
ncbi:MAG TPA: hypothetical protein VMR74_09800 [Gammaproteobacteria bacterium]|nr:hypothetical protein [Gammaproteobacteria bacterium]